MSNQNWTNHAIHLGLAAGAIENTIANQRQSLFAHQEDRVDEAREDYYDSLRALERASDDEALKEEAFICGIVYAGLMRDAGQERDFDESTVVRDIEKVMRIGRKQGIRGRPTAVERLRELEAVHEAG